MVIVGNTEVQILWQYVVSLEFWLMFCMGVELVAHTEGGMQAEVCKNRALGEYLGLRGTRSDGSGENYITRNLMICTAQTIYLG